MSPTTLPKPKKKAAASPPVTLRTRAQLSLEEKLAARYGIAQVGRLQFVWDYGRQEITTYEDLHSDPRRMEEHLKQKAIWCRLAPRELSHG